MKLYNRLLLILITAFLMFMPILAITNVKAQAYRGLIIDELRYNIDNVNPGDTIYKSFNVIYDFQPLEDGSYKPVTITFDSKNFSQGSEGGRPLFLPDGTYPVTASLADWVVFEKQSITLDEPNEEATVSFRIEVPSNAEAGGKYAAVFIENNQGDLSVEELEGSGFGLNAALGPLVFLTVNGDLNNDLKLDSLHTTNIKAKKTSFFFNPPVNVVASFKNEGNVHAIPRGRVYIHKGENFVADSIISFDLNPTGGSVLPGTTRDFIFTWDPESLIKTVKEQKVKDGKNVDDYSTDYSLKDINNIHLGNYKVTVQYGYENTDGAITDTITSNASFRMFPWQLLLIIIIILVLTILLIKIKKPFSSSKKNIKAKYN